MYLFRYDKIRRGSSTRIEEPDEAFSPPGFGSDYPESLHTAKTRTGHEDVPVWMIRRRTVRAILS